MTQLTLIKPSQPAVRDKLTALEAQLTCQLPSEGKKTEELTSPPAVAEAKKMVARYCLLSWAMCLTTISNSFADTVGTTKALKERGLLTEDELAALQVSHDSSVFVFLFFISVVGTRRKKWTRG